MLQLVIPAYNEQARLPRTLRELRREARRHRATLGPVEVIVVDNASTDATSAVALEASTPAMPVRVIHCAVPGKGAAVRAGVAVTSADIVGFMDADGATHLDALVEAWRRISLGADVAIGSRAAAGSDTSARHSRLREAGARRYRALTALVVPGVADTQCGFKIMHGRLAREVFDTMRTRGFSFDVELLARCQARGAVIAEFPVQWADVPGSTFDPLRHGLGSFANLAVIALRMRRVQRISAPAPAVVGSPAVAVLRPVAAEA